MEMILNSFHDQHIERVWVRELGQSPTAHIRPLSRQNGQGSLLLTLQQQLDTSCVWQNAINWLLLMPEKFPYLCITVVHLTTGEALLPHRDIQNHRLFRNITTSFGDWTGEYYKLMMKVRG